MGSRIVPLTPADPVHGRRNANHHRTLDAIVCGKYPAFETVMSHMRVLTDWPSLGRLRTGGT
jgi:hypothetical protein